MRIIKYVVFSCKKKENTNQEEMESYDIYIYIYIKSYHDQMQCTGEFNALNHTFICHKQKSSCKNCRIH